MNPLLQVNNLHVAYPSKKFFKPALEIIHGVSLDLAPGETLGIVGESGSGKTTIGRAVLGLAPVTKGSIEFEGKDISHAGKAERRKIARDLQVVFQDPYSSLNPAMAVGDILSEPLVTLGATRADARRRVRTLLDQVGLPHDAADRLPREFSGGQRQRVAIARALGPKPRLIVCDEPVSALDLSTQALVLELLLDIQRETGVAYLFISHDLAVVRHISHRVAVVYRGEIVETGPAEDVTLKPEHPYTQRLLLAAPIPHPVQQERRRAERLRLREQQREQHEQTAVGLSRA